MVVPELTRRRKLREKYDSTRMGKENKIARIKATSGDESIQFTPTSSWPEMTIM